MSRIKIILIVIASVLGVIITGFLIWYFILRRKENFNFKEKGTIYCGNNKNNPKLLNGEQIPGTRYQCFKKGVGIGKNMPPSIDDTDYSPLYVKEKIFCGNGNTVPQGYDKLGIPSECLQKGVGVGKKIVNS